MMGQAARDPIFFACLAVAEQDAPSSGDMCLRCHTPFGWMLGRSNPTDGSQLQALDRDGVACDFCHRDLDPVYKAGVSPVEDQAVYDEAGNEVGPGGGGYLVLRRPWPAMLRTIYNDPDRFVKQYWSKYPGVYLTGDSAKRDKDGYYWIIGRVDDVIKVSGYRLGTAEIESALVSHPSVAEAAVIGLPHEVKGTAIHAFVLLRHTATGSAALRD